MPLDAVSVSVFTSSESEIEDEFELVEEFPPNRSAKKSSSRLEVSESSFLNAGVSFWI
jgi:hypothetical protein